MFLEGLEVFLFLWLHQLVFLAIPSFLVFWFTRRFAHYEIWECIVFLIPFATWFSMLHLYPKPSGLGNLYDWLPLVIALPIAMALRAFAGKSQWKRLTSIMLVLGLCLIAIWAHFHFPSDNGLR